VRAAVDAIPVTRGQRLYFRVQSIFDGAYDQVAWNPEITYTGVDTTRTDVNELPEYRYQASADFTLAGRTGATTTVPLTGALRLAGTFEKTGITTDDVRLSITRNGTEVFTHTFGYAASGIDSPPDTYANVARITLDALGAYAEDVRAARQIKGGINYSSKFLIGIIVDLSV